MHLFLRRVEGNMEVEERKLRPFKVRDLREENQFKIDDVYLNGYAKYLTPAITCVYLSLARHANFNTQEAFPSEKLIAKEHGITDRTVRYAIKLLKEINIIGIERERSANGKWLNNVYILWDKSEWKRPEEIKDLWLTRGNKRQQPEEINDKTRGNDVPIKDNKILRITKIKDNKDIDISISKDIDISSKGFNFLIFKFKAVNPLYENLFSNITQRKALQRLVDKFGEEKMSKLLDALPETINDKFAPRITTPLQLENKFAELVMYFKKKKASSMVVKI